MAPGRSGKALSRGKATFGGNLEVRFALLSVREGECFRWREKHTQTNDEKKPGGFVGSTEKFRINKDHGPGRGHSWKSAVGARLLRARGALPSGLRCREGRGAGTQVESPFLPIPWYRHTSPLPQANPFL